MFLGSDFELHSKTFFENHGFGCRGVRLTFFLTRTSAAKTYVFKKSLGRVLKMEQNFWTGTPNYRILMILLDSPPLQSRLNMDASRVSLFGDMTQEILRKTWNLGNLVRRRCFKKYKTRVWCFFFFCSTFAFCCRRGRRNWTQVGFLIKFSTKI